MSHCDYIYYAALFFVAFPSAPFNRVALVVVCVWTFGQLPFLAGLPQGKVDLWADTFGLVFALAYSFAQTSSANRVAALMFAPMMFIDFMRIRYGLDAKGLSDYQRVLDNQCWWGSFAAGMIQVVALPIDNDWIRARKTWACYRKSKSVDWFFRVARRYAL